VFGAEQVEGYEIPVINETNPDMQFEIAENYFSGTGAKLVDDDHAYYTPALDYIGMPKFEKFDSADSYYNTLFHELAHWTGHESRLDRNSVKKFKVSKFSDDYAYEELIAELGGMFNCLSLGIVSTPQKGNAQYINSWLGALKDNKRLVFRASKQAQQVVDYTDKLTESIELKEAV
jgi:antirestriction protein ArdC